MPQGQPRATEILAALPLACFAVDPEGRVASANVAAQMLLNQAQASIIGNRIEAVLGADLPAPDGDAPFAAYDFELGVVALRGQRVDLSVVPMPDRPGWRLFTVHGRGRAHLAGRWHVREGGTLSAIGAAAMLAHEIKNPLSGIRGAAQLLEMSAGPAGSELTTLIRDEVDRIAALIDRMQDFTDTRPLDLSPQNIHAILDHARKVAMQGFAAKILIREVYDPSLPPVRCNRDALVQVVINLLKNAVEAGASAITLTTAYRHGMTMVRRCGGQRLSLPIELCVIDDGPGAPPELAEHLFDPFVTGKESGTGLGLALVDKLVSDQGGVVEYAREGDPPRTIFRILLPRMGKEQ